MNELKNKWPLIARIRKEWATSIHWFRPWNIASTARTSLSDGRSLTAWLTLLSEGKRNKTMKEMKRRNGIYLIITVMLSVANNIRKTIYCGFFLLKKLWMLCLPSPAGTVISEITVHSLLSLPVPYSKIIHMDFCGAAVRSMCPSCKWRNLSVPV